MEKQLEKPMNLDAGVSSPVGDEMEQNALKRKISALEKELQLKDEAHAARIWKLKAANRKANAQLWSLHEKYEKATGELQAVEKAFIRGLQRSNFSNLGIQCDTVYPKAMGVFDPSEEWAEIIFGFYSSSDDEDSVLAKGNEFVRYWQARVREPDFDASICEEGEDGTLKYTIDGDHDELNEVLENYGPEVYEAVCNAHLQVKAYGTGTVLWHYGENRKATVSEVLEEPWSLSFKWII